MSYFTPFVDASGLHINTYTDIENQLISLWQGAYGADIYLGNDSKDFQLIAAIAQMLYDTNLAAQLSYNSHSPVLANGANLDTIVAVNGLKRKSASPSVVSLTLTGTAFAVITNGIVADTNGNQWNLPASVTLDSSGHATVSGVCQLMGANTALAGQVNIISTPTLGWTSVTNASAATPGRDIETDAELKARQALTTAGPSQGLTTGILAAILDLADVAAAQIYENDTSVPQTVINGVTCPFPGFPANSLTLVIDGGIDSEIAAAYASRKPPGCYANGDVIQLVVDRFSTPTTIRYYRPTDIVIDLRINLKGLIGYSQALGTNAKQAAADFINSLTAGENLVLSQVEYAMVALNTNPRAPFFSITSILACVHGGTPVAADMTMFFNQRARTVIGNITIVVS